MFKVFAILILLLKTQVGLAAAPENSPRALVHLLDYLAQDYGGAVKNGRVVSQTEYKEQQEFSEMAVEINSRLSETQRHPDIQAELDNLRRLISGKAPESEVSALAKKTKLDVVKVTGLEIAPASWPSLQLGRQLFSQNCVTCHGPKGDGSGPAGLALKPRPANFLDKDKVEYLSPFQAFNAIRIGVPGTGMPPFSMFSDKDTWALAFYVKSLIHEQYVENSIELKKVPPSVPLEKVSTLSDENLRELLSGSDEEKKLALATLRTHSGDQDLPTSLLTARFFLDQARIEYSRGNLPGAKNKALTAYLEGVEPAEPRLKATDPVLTSDLEGAMGTVRSVVEAHMPVESLDKAIDDAKKLIERAEKILKQESPSPWLTFFIAVGILLREGFEAVLIIIALLGVIRATGEKKAAAWVHGGWVVALLCGVAIWFASGWLIDFTGAQRELMEGVTSLLAVLVLLYMGFWLHRKTEIGRWTAFINSRVKEALKGKNLFGLAVISFVAVFREAFETVLFLRALWLESGAETRTALLVGVLGALAFVFVLSWALLKYASRIPIRQVFDFSSSLMAVLAVILIGKGFHSLQETGLLTITASPLNLRVDLIGFYPTLETTLSQLVIVGFCVALWRYGKRPSKLFS